MRWEVFMKQCKDCGEYKAETDFYGIQGECKECTKIRVHSNYSNRREQYSKYEHDRNKKRRVYMLKQQKKYRLNNPEKYHARNIVAHALRNGTLVKEPCMKCGNPKTQCHHKDYSKPLEVDWLCFKCHRELEHNQIVSTIPF